MAVQRTVTTPGSYQAPVEGIVDYGAFQRGLEKGIAPGLAFLAEKKKKDEEAEKTELDVGVKAFTGINKNIMTGDVDLKTNDFFEINSVEAMSRFRPQYIDAVKRGDTKTQNEILRSIGKAKQSYNNLSEYIKGIGSPDVFDGKVSNTRFLDENGQEISFNGVDFTQVNNNNPQNIRQGTKRNKQGIVKQGFYILKDGEQYFLNTQDMDQAYRDSHFEIKDNLQGDIGASTRQGGTAELFTRKADYYTDSSKTISITLSNGNTVQTAKGDGMKYINPDFYQKAESNASVFAQNKYKTTSDPTNESAWNQLTNDSVFVSKLGGKQISAEERKSGEYTDEEKILLLQDYATERWKISVADQGYVTGKNGRALKRNELQYNKSKTTTTRPIDEGGGLSINFGGKDLDDDLLKRTRELLAITSIQTNDQGQINQASRDNVVAYIQGQDLNFETKKKGTEELISGKIDGVTSDMITVTSRKITTGPDSGQTKAIISIQPKPQVIDNETVQFEPIQYDLTQASDIEKLLANQYGFATDKGKKFKAQYDPVLGYLKALRRGTINEDGTIAKKPLP